MFGQSDSIQKVVNALNTAAPLVKTAESVYGHLEQIVGTLATKEITLNANNTSAAVNCFQITGTVKVIRLYGFITDAITLVNLTDGYFDFYDSGTAIDITASIGIILSAHQVGSFFVKDSNAASALALANNDNRVLIESSANKIFNQFTLIQKSGADSFIRWKYTTTDAPINAKLTMYCEFIGLGGGNLVAV